jgi:hypothetical protein
MTTLSLSAVAAACASSLVEAKGYDDKATACKEESNKAIAVLHDAKAVVGRNGKCSIASSFYDALVFGGWAKGTANNYLSVFRDAVKSGKPVTDWNPNRKGAKGKAKTKGKAKALADLFRPAFNHESGESFMALCEAIENQYQADSIKTMYQGFVEYFKAEGDEISE